MRILSRFAFHQRDERSVDVALGLQGLGGTPAANPEHGIGGVVVGDLPQGFRPSEGVAREAVVAFPAGLVHAPDCAPAEGADARPRRRTILRRQRFDLPAMRDKLRRGTLRVLAYLHPKKTAIAVEAEYGIPSRTYQGWLGGRPPSVDHVLVLLAALRDRYQRVVDRAAGIASAGRYRVRVSLLRRRAGEVA